MKLLALFLAAFLLGAACRQALVVVAVAAVGWALWSGAREGREGRR